MGLGTYLGGGAFQLRGALWLALTDVGQIGTGTITDDAGGGGTTLWTWGGSIPCRVDPLAGNESMAGGRLSDRSTHEVMVPPETQVDVANRFLIMNRGTYEVTAVADHTLERVQSFEVVKLS